MDEFWSILVCTALRSTFGVCAVIAVGGDVAFVTTLTQFLDRVNVK